MTRVLRAEPPPALDFLAAPPAVHSRANGCSLILSRIATKRAAAWIDSVHRHHEPPQGLVFALAARCKGEIVGVVTVGRPVSRVLDARGWAELTRLATCGHDNACSFLYAAAANAARALGFSRIVTYTLRSESGVSLRAAGWTCDDTAAGGGSWARDERPRYDRHPTETKVRWGKALAPHQKRSERREARRAAP